MKIAGIFFDAKNQKAIIDALMNLPEKIVPTRYSSDEVKLSSARMLKDGGFSAFQSENIAGYFLYSDFATYDISLSENGKSSIFMDIGEGQPQEILLRFLKSMSKVGVDFGFAAENDEYMHRNRHQYVLGDNRIETWVGRDLEKYIPGLYWVTYISMSLEKKHSFNLAHIADTAITIDSDEQGHLIRFFEVPTDWSENAEKIDKACLEQCGVFSLADVEKNLPDNVNYLQLTSTLADWN